MSGLHVYVNINTAHDEVRGILPDSAIASCGTSFSVVNWDGTAEQVAAVRAAMETAYRLPTDAVAILFRPPAMHHPPGPEWLEVPGYGRVPLHVSRVRFGPEHASRLAR